MWSIDCCIKVETRWHDNKVELSVSNLNVIRALALLGEQDERDLFEKYLYSDTIQGGAWSTISLDPRS